MENRLLRAAAFLSLFLFISGLLSGAWLYYRFPAAWVSAKISGEVRKKTGWTLDLPPLSPFPLGTFDLGPTAFSSPEGEPLFRMKGVHARYEIWPLFKGLFVLNELAVDEPEIFLKKTAGTWNWERALKLLPPSPPLFAGIDVEKTALPELWPAVEKALAERVPGLPSMRLTGMSANRLRIHLDDGANLRLETEPANLSGKLLWPGDRTLSGEFHATSEAASAGVAFSADGKKRNLVFSGPTISARGSIAAQATVRIENAGADSFSLRGSLSLLPSILKKPWAAWVPGGKIPDLNASADISGRWPGGAPEIRIGEASIASRAFGVNASLKGRFLSKLPLQKLAQALKDKRIKTLRESVETDLSGAAEISPPKNPGMVKGLSLRGTVRGAFAVVKNRTDRIDLSLHANADHFSAALENGPEISGLSFHLPLRKTITLGPPPAAAPAAPDAALWTEPFSENLSPLSPFARSVRIDAVRAAGFRAQRVELDAGFDGTNLIVDRFSAGLLGGTVWGRLALIPAGEALRFTASFEAAEIDAALLSGETSEGDARISADARCALNLLPGRALAPEGLLDDIEASFHLTKVGDRTLDRLIAYLDPKGENPSMVQARGLLRNRTVSSALRNPSVSFSAAHGILDADIVLPGVKLVDLSIPIHGVSVKTLLRLESVKKALAAAAPALEAAKYLRLRGIDDNGDLVFSGGTPQ